MKVIHSCGVSEIIHLFRLDSEIAAMTQAEHDREEYVMLPYPISSPHDLGSASEQENL